MKNFCVTPWYSKEINLKNNEEIVCCWIEETVNLPELKQEFINGLRPAACKKCWKLEDAGIESRRQMENRFLDYALDRDIELIAKDAIDGKASVMLYQFDLGSLCNSTCVTCSPRSSTSWQKLVKKQISIKQENTKVQRTFEIQKEKINWKNLKRINFIGGEPLLIEQSFKVLENLQLHDNTDCLISFITNTSVKLTDKHLRSFEKFNNISCCVSIDGVESLFEYIRYPLQWTDLLENLNQYRKVFRDVVVSFTVSNLNIHERDKIIKWFDSQGLKYIENHVQQPAYFSPAVQPGHLLWPEFVKNIKIQDELKGISIDNYIPYIANLIKGS
jgi:MoaA/NifB/PqqE/SkfB family radical SAM enzyme